MPGNMYSYLMILVAAIVATPAPAEASIPPPPVNQLLGIPDGRFKDMTYVTCLGCHGNPAGAVAPVKIGYLPDRHHLRVDTPIGDYSASPYPEKSTDGKHKCITCHLLDWVEDASRPLGGYFQFAEDPADARFRNCLNCHAQKKNQRGELIATVHHLTDRAQQAQCHICHGSLINNPNDEHRIPDPATHPDDEENHYEISLTTPWPGEGYLSKVQLRWALEANFAYRLDIPRNPTPEQLIAKQEAEELIDYLVENITPPVGENGRRMGNCAYCHYAGTDDLTGQVVNINYANHHGTGIGQPGSGSVHSCDLCHQPSTPPNFTIRGCERCHGITSLHSIEYDADSDGIVVGEEKPFFGHIGTRKDCDGCHRNYQGESAAASTTLPFTTAIVPGIEALNKTQFIGGSDNRLVVTGSAFVTTSAADDSRSPSWLRLVDNSGAITEIYPDELSTNRMEVTLPANLEPGSYQLAVARQGATADEILTSSSINILVTPDMTVDSITCNSGVITITGAGFGSYLDSENSGTSVSDLYGGRKCAITSWSGSRIVANCQNAAVEAVRVDGLFDSATAETGCNRTDRPRWWSIWSWWLSWSWSRR